MTVSMPTISTWTGLTRTSRSHIIKKFSIFSKDVIIIGDSTTDVPLFRVIKTSIVLENAPTLIKGQHDHSCRIHRSLEELDKLASKMFGV